jgi:hypothetical protein
MNRFFAIMLLGGLLLPGMSHAALVVGDRVFIPLYSVHLREDGYATGEIESTQGDKLTIIMRELVPGKGKTLYGTCSPSGTSPLAGAEILSDRVDTPVLRKTFPANEVMPWRAGKEEYLERENVATIFYKWLGDGMALTPDRARLGAKRARQLGNSPGVQRMAQALDLAAIQVDSTGGQGFPVSAAQLLSGAPQVLLTVSALEQQEPASTGEAMRAILDGRTPLHSDDAVAMAMAKVLLTVREAWGQLPTELGSVKAAGAWPQATGVLEAYVATLTNQGQASYRGKSAADWNSTLASELKNGGWPTLP